MSSSAAGLWARIRLADRRDVPNICRLIRQMAEFEKLSHHFSATEASLAATLFPCPSPPPPFSSFTVLILELSQSPNPQQDQEQEEGDSPPFRPILRRLAATAPAEDPEAEEFASPRGGGWTVAGFLLCFPNYPSYLAKPGLYVEDIFVRKAWRRQGLGKMMLSAAAGEAARRGMERVEWCVLDWNVNAISFYEKMGAEVMQDYRICRLTGASLQAYKDGENTDQN